MEFRSVTIFLHAGTHRTGSTSLQTLLGDHRDLLHRLGYDFYKGRHKNPNNHIELYLSTLRQNRDSLAKARGLDFALNHEYQKQVAQSVQSFIDSSRVANQIFTTEGLSYLRFPDEFERLHVIFGDYAKLVKVVLVLRTKENFIRSYRNQILKKPGRLPLNDPTSALYVGPDTWLTDYETLTDGFRKSLGVPVQIINYDSAVAENGSVLPAILDAMKIDPSLMPHSGYHLNKSTI